MPDDPMIDPLSDAGRAAEDEPKPPLDIPADAGSETAAVAPLESSPSDIDRLVEEQMLAQLAEAEAVQKKSMPDVSGIREPDLHFPQPNLEMPTAQPVEFPQLKESRGSAEPRNFDLLMDVKLPVSIELGRTTMAISDILNLGSGSVVELDKLAGEPVDLLVNNKVIAQGEVVVVDENFGIRITSLVSPQERIKSL